MKLTIESGSLAKALALIAATVERRNTIPALSCVLIEAEGAAVRLTATDLDSRLAIELAATVETAGRVLIDAKALADTAKALPRAAFADIETDTGETDNMGRAVADVATIKAGRTRLKLKTLPADDFPQGLAFEAAETWEAPAAEAGADVRAEGVDIGDKPRKLLAKLAKRAGDVVATVERRDETSERAGALRVTMGDCTLTTPLYAPDLYANAPRNPFAYAPDQGAELAALRYLQSLRASHGLPPIDEHAGRIICHAGRAVGLTVGQGFRDAGAVAYPEGAYSLPMPATAWQDVAMRVAVVTVDVDGQRQPLRCKFTGSGAPLAIELTAEQVADLCGPVDPSTFVEIEPLAFKHGQIVARGKAARAFNMALENQRRVMRKQSDREKLDAYCAGPAAYTAAIGSLVILDAPASEPAPEPVEAPAVEPVPAPVPEPAPDYAEPVPAPVAPEPVPAPSVTPEPVETAAPDPAPAAASLEHRLARIEAALGLQASPKRTPAHAAAIRRAWAMRRTMRQRAELDRAALLQANGYNRIIREENERLTERVAKVEAFAGERAELVAEIDRLRIELRSNGVALAFNVGDAGRQRFCRSRIIRRAATLRRDVARTRAERDGIAGNLAAMTRRVAADARTIEALRNGASAPADGLPRFIMSSR